MYKILLLTLFFVSGAIADPLVIAHRGASGLYPEHTLEAYRAAIEMGADYIEPDLVVTRDGVLIARHDIYLSRSTNVAEVYPGRKRTIANREDWFVHDFTLEEIRQLKARQPFGERSREFDDEFGIPTLSEILTLTAEHQTSEPVGIYPELKAPAFFLAQGHDVATLLLTELAGHERYSDVMIQSFDADTLRRMNTLTDLPLVMLVAPRNRLSPLEPNVPLAEIAEFADGVGAMKLLLLDQQGQDSGFVRQARQLGLFVHVWTFRDDQVPHDYPSAQLEIERYLQLGVDGFFTDFPDTGVRALNAYRKGLQE